MERMIPIGPQQSTTSFQTLNKEERGRRRKKKKKQTGHTKKKTSEEGKKTETDRQTDR
jgi:hypothetical protein